MSLAVILPDAVRAASVLAALYNFFTVPILVWRRTAKNRKMLVEILFIVGVNGLLLGRIAQALSKFGDSRLLWWGAPLTLVACLCLARSTEIGLISLIKSKS